MKLLGIPGTAGNRGMKLEVTWSDQRRQDPPPDHLGVHYRRRKESDNMPGVLLGIQGISVKKKWHNAILMEI